MRFRRLLTFFAPIVGAFLVVFLLGLVFYPWITGDFCHTMGMLTAGGGVPFHPGHFEQGSELFGSHTLFFTGDAAPPVGGDIKIELVGPAPISYVVTSRLPPGVPTLNHLHSWYRFEDDTLKGVTPGDRIVICLKVKPPTALGKYELTFIDVETKQVYLALPVVFTLPGEVVEEAEGGPPGH